MKELLEAARARCFFFGTGDAAQALCAANVPFGLAKIAWVQRRLGFPGDASFVAAPDTTVSRNVERWADGFGYGGVIRYTGDFVTLSIKSNLCGMLLVGLREVPPAEEVLARADRVKALRPELDGIPVTWDLGSSNHFVSVLELDRPLEGFTHAALLHGSGTEIRGEGPWGPGLYPADSPALRRAMETHETPWGPLRILRGDAADGYRAGYAWIERFVHRRRELIAEALFPGCRVISNTTHQGSRDPGTYNLGCLQEAPGTLVPVALRAELPIPLVRVLPNLGEDALRRAGVLERAEATGLRAHLGSVNLLPHGGGYAYPQYRGVRRVLELGDRRYFELEPAAGEHRELVHNLRGQPFTYRGEEVVRALEAYGMGEVVSRGTPVTVLMV
ncbi:MAG: hypothetical protein FJ098_13975 [Deltaproteobacteria bacterium]|nr:hypothetical protein [Deltaproteobacteria bacterium]